jgi:hypothetical protein
MFDNKAGLISLFGGTAVMLVCGSFFLWANISTYVLSYIYLYDPTVDIKGVFLVDLLLVLLNCLGHLIGSYMLRNLKMNPKL